MAARTTALTLVCAVASLALASARTTIVDHTPGATIKIGALLPFATDPLGYSSTVQFILDDINGGVKYPSLLPNHTLEIDVAPTSAAGAGDDTPLVGFYAVTGLVDAGAALVFGPVGGGELTEVAAYAAGQEGVNMISASSALNALSDTEAFPTYTRIIGSLSSEADALVSYLQYLGWTRAGAFVGIGSATVDMLDTFAASADAAGFELVQPVQFPLTSAGDADAMRPYFEILRASTARVVLFLAPTEYIIPLAELMRQAGLTVDEYTFVFPSVSSFDIADRSAPETLASLIGSLMFLPLALDVTTSARRRGATASRRRCWVRTGPTQRRSTRTARATCTTRRCSASRPWTRWCA